MGLVANGHKLIEDMAGFLLIAWMAQTSIPFLDLLQIGAE